MHPTDFRHGAGAGATVTFDARNYPILYVDDEEDNLNVSRFNFRSAFTVFTASSGEEGLEVLRNRPIAVVISDQRMPKMTGLEFLREARRVRPQALGIMLTLFSAAGESTASLLGSAAWILADRPEIQRQLRENPELLGAFIEETLRFESPFRGHYRHVWRDTTLAGVAVPADTHLLLMWGAANCDPAHFEAPDEFRLDRGTAKGHITFGKGVHFCVGAALARLEARIVLRVLLERTTWIEAADIGEWLPSILVRRRNRLRLAIR